MGIVSARSPRRNPNLGLCSCFAARKKIADGTVGRVKPLPADRDRSRGARPSRFIDDTCVRAFGVLTLQVKDVQVWL